MTSDLEILTALWQAAVAAAQPAGKFEGRLPARPAGRTLVLGAGKAAASMARAFEVAYGPCEGLVITRYGHGAATRWVEVVEAAHPVPDAAGLAAADRILALARSATADDLVIGLISGGASALLTRPADGISLAAKQAINRTLLRSGAPIKAMNDIRKALSAIKGGRLAAAAAPARVVTYLISDVPGDDPATIGSGPTIARNPSQTEVFALLDRYAITLEADLVAAIAANTPPAADAGTEIHLLATPMMALEAAAERALAMGVTPVILGDAIEGEAREVGTVLSGIARSVARHGVPAARPCVLLSGGETTVTLHGGGQGGRGGRNAEFLLGLAMASAGIPNLAGLACDTDGIDGSEDNAGAWFDGTSLARAAARGFDPRAVLEAHDSHALFAALDQLIVTGPTLTNVNDFRAILLRP